MKRARGNGYSLQNILMTAFLTCMGVLLLFVLLTLVPRISQLLQQNAVERTKETVLQSVSSLDIYIDNMLSTLHFASSQLSGRPEETDEAQLSRLLLMQQSRTDIVTLAFFAQDGSLRYGTAAVCACPPRRCARANGFKRRWSGRGPSPIFPPRMYSSCLKTSARWW